MKSTLGSAKGYIEDFSDLCYLEGFPVIEFEEYLIGDWDAAQPLEQQALLLPLDDLAYFNLAYALIGQDRQKESDPYPFASGTCPAMRTPD